MDLIINIILSIVFTVIDIYILKFYFESKDIKIKNIYYLFLYLCLLTLSLVTQQISRNLLISSVPFLISSALLIIILKSDYKIINFIILSISRFLSVCLTAFLYEFIFDKPFFHYQINIFFFHYLIYNFLNRYITYICLSFVLRKTTPSYSINLRFFKTTSIIISSLFFIDFIIYNEKLFYFPNIGMTFTLMIIFYNTLLIFFDRYQTKHEAIEQEMEMINQAVKSEKEYIIKKNEADDTVREMRHDLKNNFTIINGYLNDGKIQDAQEYIEKIVGKINEASNIIHSGYSSLDSIINDKISIMKEKNINYEEMIAPINIGNIEIEDLSLLIGIALDNAIEAAEKVEGLREIKLKIKNHKNLLMINIQNSVKEGRKIIFGKTSKLDKKNHGFGVNKIKYFAKLYCGEANYSNEDNKVILRIFLNTETD